MTEQTCEQRIDEQWQSTRHDLEALWELCKQDSEAYHDDLGRLDEYGLAFDYVEPFTFEDQRAGYWRYQMSWGGPSDEIRFWCDSEHQLQAAEYWFLDWFDGAKLRVDDDPLVRELWDCYFESYRECVS